MADVGGENGHKSCQKMLAKALTDNVAKKYCMQGHSSNKMAFNTTAIWNIIKGTVALHYSVLQINVLLMKNSSLQMSSYRILNIIPKKSIHLLLLRIPVLCGSDKQSTVYRGKKRANRYEI